MAGIKPILKCAALLLLLGRPAWAEQKLDDLLSQTAIAVELRGEAPAPYDFSGAVGTLRVDLPRNQMRLVTLSAPYKPVLNAQVFTINELQRFDDSVDFSCTDHDGMRWRGKIFLSKKFDQPLGVEIIRRDSPRKIVNLSDEGRGFLAEHKLDHLYLGM